MKHKSRKMFVAMFWTLVCMLALVLPSYAAGLQTEEYDLPRYKTEKLQSGVDYDIGEGFTIYLDNSALNVSPNSATPFHTQKWVVENHVNEGTWVDYDSQLDKVLSGAPGVTLNKTYSRSWSATTNLTAGIKKSEVSAQIGFSITGSFSASSGGSFTVPQTHNGKQVERVELISYKVWERHTFDVYLDSTHFDNPVYYGNFYSDKPAGIHFEPVYYYK